LRESTLNGNPVRSADRAQSRSLNRLLSIMDSTARHHDHSFRLCDRFLTVGDDDPRDPHRRDGGVHGLLVLRIGMGGAFVHDQDFWLPVESAGPMTSVRGVSTAGPLA
jgi:hypothetical protein